jgi:sphingomyelin phosphodiesterase acid-like 3
MMFADKLFYLRSMRQLPRQLRQLGRLLGYACFMSLLVYLEIAYADVAGTTTPAVSPELPQAHRNGMMGNFLVIPDIHLNSATTHRMEISPAQPSYDNDIDLTTLQTLLDKIRDGINGGSIPVPDFIISLGDFPRHRRQSVDEVISDEQESFSLLKNFAAQFTPEIPIFFVFGNHDSLPAVWGQFYSTESYSGFHSPYEIAQGEGWVNGFLSTGVKCGVTSTATTTIAAATHKAKASTPCIINENKTYGYYSAYLQDKLRMIALNTVLFTPQRIGTTEADAVAQLNWLQTELQSAASNQESVLLVSHVPFGDDLGSTNNFWVASDQTTFLRLLQTYQKNIIGILAGHTHREESKIVQDGAANNKNIALLMIAAELASISANAPSFRTIYYSATAKKGGEIGGEVKSSGENRDGGNWELTDYATYNFIDGKARGVRYSYSLTEPLLQKLYEYSNYYCGGNAGDYVGGVHVHAKNILECAQNITAQKMETYYTAGNPNYMEEIKIPQHIYVVIPSSNPNSGGGGSSGSGLGWGVGAIAAAVAGVVTAVSIHNLHDGTHAHGHGSHGNGSGSSGNSGSSAK